MTNDLEPELPLDIPTAEEASLLPDRGYKREWEEQSVRLFLRWKANVDAASHTTRITKIDAMEGFKPIPDRHRCTF